MILVVDTEQQTVTQLIGGKANERRSIIIRVPIVRGVTISSMPDFYAPSRDFYDMGVDFNDWLRATVPSGFYDGTIRRPLG